MGLKFSFYQFVFICCLHSGMNIMSFLNYLPACRVHSCLVLAKCIYSVSVNDMPASNYCY
jgi:hypothetical protein